MTHISAQGLENARSDVVAHSDHYLSMLEFLGKYPAELSLMPDSTAIIASVGHIANVLLNTQRSAVFLTANNQIERQYVEGLPDTWVAVLKTPDLLKRPFSALSTLAGGRPNIQPAVNLSGSQLPAEWRDLLASEHIQSALLARLQAEDRLFGSILVVYGPAQSPNPHDANLLDILATQAAVALKNLALNTTNEIVARSLENRLIETEQELADALVKAGAAEKFKTRLLSAVSHELRTPLAVIKAHATTQLSYYDRLPKERHVHYLTTINDEADRLTTMITSLLDMAHLEAGDLDVQPRQLEPLSLLKQYVDDFCTQYPDYQFTLVAPHELAPIYADPDRLAQIIANLVENATKYSPDGSTVEVGMRPWDDALEIWVKDQGEGLASDQARYVFARFYQVEKLNQTSARPGIGLGLAICKGLVENMGGRIWCESNGLNTGARFAFTIPWPNRANLPVTTPTEKTATGAVENKVETGARD